MKFAEHLSAHITPEWRKQYVQYELMKEMLYEFVEKAPSSEVTDPEVVKRFFAQFEEKFFQFCDAELLKINTFFSEKLAEATRKMSNLSAELALAQEAESGVHVGGSGSGTEITNPRQRRPTMIPSALAKRVERKKVGARKLYEVKLAFSEFYLSLILLQNYQTLNFTGFRKILKKHDKLLEVDHGGLWRQTNVETAPFYSSKQVDHLIKETEDLFTSKLEGGDRQRAMKRLRVPPLEQKSNPWTVFRVGLFTGVLMTFVLVIIVAAVTLSTIKVEHKGDWEAALRMYRGTFLVFQMIFLLGINTYGWRASGVNHVLIFELDPRDNLSHQELLEVACFFGTVWSVSVICYMFSGFLNIPVFANPLWLVLFTLAYLINPIRILHFRARMWLLRVIYRIFTAPFHHVGFADFWLADQMNSLTTVFLDFEFFICYYATAIDWKTLALKTDDTIDCGSSSYGVTPVVACLPAWFRFAQCLRRYRDTRLAFPHLVNAGKYSTTFFVVIFSTLKAYYENAQKVSLGSNPFFYLWILASVISTCYTTFWDLRMDWGLLDKNCGENKYLREEVVYSSKGYYYFAIVEDVILRCAWIVTVSVGQLHVIDSQILKSVLATFEVFRRFVWNFFRLENEHLNNCGQFRAVRDISIAPMDSNDQQLLEKMMDDEEGVINRKPAGSKTKKKFGGRGLETQVLLEEDEEEQTPRNREMFPISAAYMSGV